MQQRWGWRWFCFKQKLRISADFLHVWCPPRGCLAGQEQAGYVAGLEGTSHGESQAEPQPCPFQLHRFLQHPMTIRSLLSPWRGSSPASYQARPHPAAASNHGAVQLS